MTTKLFKHAEPHAKALLNHALSQTSVDQDGNVTTRGFSFQNDLAALSALIDFDCKLHSHHHYQVVHKSFLQTAKLSDPTLDEFLKKVRQNQINLLNRKTNRFKILSFMNVRRWPIRTMTVNESKMIFSSSRISIRHYAELEKKKYPRPRDYVNRVYVTQPVTSTVSAKTKQEATQIASANIEYIRGLANYTNNHRIGFRISSGRLKPINSIYFGFLHGVFGEDKQLDQDFYSYEEHFDPTLYERSYVIKDRFEVEFRLYHNLIARSVFRELIIEALIQYGSALDNLNFDAAKALLWAVLERLTLTGGPNFSHNNTVERAASLWKNQDRILAILFGLRVARNNFIHRGERTIYAEAELFRLKNIVEVLIQFYVENPYQLKNIDEANQFLKLSNNRADLTKLRRVLNKKLAT